MFFLYDTKEEEEKKLVYSMMDVLFGLREGGDAVIGVLQTNTTD